MLETRRPTGPIFPARQNRSFLPIAQTTGEIHWASVAILTHGEQIDRRT